MFLSYNIKWLSRVSRKLKVEAQSNNPQVNSDLLQCQTVGVTQSPWLSQCQWSMGTVNEHCLESSWYCAWRVATGLHRSIMLNFIVTSVMHKLLPRLLLGASQACIQTARYIVAVWAWDCGEWECLSEFLAAGGYWRRHIACTRRRLAGPSAAVLPTSSRDQEDATIQVLLTLSPLHYESKQPVLSSQ